MVLVPLLFERLRPVGYAGIVVPVAFVAAILATRRYVDIKLLPAFAGPLAAPMNAAIFIRAGIVGWRCGGVVWRWDSLSVAAVASRYVYPVPVTEAWCQLARRRYCAPGLPRPFVYATVTH